MQSSKTFRPRGSAIVLAGIGFVILLAGAATAHQDKTETTKPQEAPAMPSSPMPGTMGPGTMGPGTMGPGAMGPGTMEGDSGGAMPGSGMMLPGMPGMHVPSLDSLRGKTLFIEKGCVACHAVNGVGGHDAAALDAHAKAPIMNPFEFAAVMWRMAPAMIYAQEEALGEQILFTGDELADIYAFVHDDEAQHGLSESDIPPRIRMLMHHTHGEPGGGAMMHGDELGHHHDDEDAPHEDN